MKLKKIFLEFIYTCNYECIFCRTGKYDPTKILLLKDFKNFESYIKIADLINITGTGEITLHPEFNEIIKIMTNHNKKIEFSTNGSLLTDEKIKTLEESNISILNVSLNSLDPEIYKKLTGRDLSIVLRNLDKLFNSKLKDKKLFDKSKVYLQCSFVINGYNFHEIKNFINFGMKYNINIKLGDLTASITDYDPGLLLPDNQANRDFLNECIEYAKKQGCKFHPFKFEHRCNKSNELKINEIIKGCEYIDNTIIIGATGTVKSCCWMPDVILGNVKTQTLDEIMNSDLYKDLRENIKAGSLKYCSKCRRLE